MTDEEEVRIRVEKAIGGLIHQSGLPLPIFMGDKSVDLVDRVVSNIMQSSDPETCKLVASNFVREEIVHGNWGVFVPGPTGDLRVQLRK